MFPHLNSTVGDSHAALLGGATAVVRQRSDVFDRSNRNAGRLQPRDRTFSPRSWSLHADFNLPHPHLGCSFRNRFGSALCGKGSALSATLKTDCSRRCPAHDITVRVCHRHDRVVERCLDVSNAPRHVATDFFLCLDFCHVNLTPGLKWKFRRRPFGATGPMRTLRTPISASCP